MSYECLKGLDIYYVWANFHSEPADKLIVDFCAKRAIECYQGSHLDVASRFSDIIDEHRLDAFVRLSGDSPLLDPVIIKKALKIMDASIDLVTNIFPRSYHILI